MEFTKENLKDIATFHVKGRLDSNTSPDFESAVFDTIESGMSRLIINFKDLEYISSAGLRVILKATKHLKKTDGKLTLCAMQDYVREVFEISGFDTLLPITATLEEAVNTF